MKCRCGKEAIIYLRPYRLSLCNSCFVDFYERKVRRFIRKWRLVEPGETVYVAVSGGKDSAACLAVLQQLSVELGVDVAAIHINLGITGYSEKVEDACRRLCRMLDIPLEVVNLVDAYGVGVEELARSTRRSACSVCGVVKRYLMNRVPRELGANRVATGHNLDDVVEFFFKNWTSGNYFWISKQKPLLPSTHPKVLPKIKPLFERSGLENEMYVKARGLPYEADECPHAVTSRWGEIAELVEERAPGFKLAFARGLEEIKIVAPEPQFTQCSVCGEPSSGDPCAFCRILRAAA